MSEGGTFNVVGTEICQNSGRMTKIYEESGSSKKRGFIYIVLGWLFTITSIVFVPILFGALALTMGFLTYTERSKTHGMVLMFFAATGLILGSFISFMVAGTCSFKNQENPFPIKSLGVLLISVLFSMHVYKC